MKEILRLGLALFLICVISAAILSFVYGLSRERILSQKKQEELQGLRKVLPDALRIEKIEAGDLVYYIGYDKDNKDIGKAIIVSGKGYSSDIVSCVGIDNEGRILGIEILSQAETPGLGAKIAEPAFLSKFKRRNIKDIGSHDAITGATISSCAVINAIKEKIEALIQKLKK
ncbi:MAG: RnfABCDGE type electron transport complex subunit G [Candidatus Omnitrophica bacterium]|nr:RnfABCDGE type electron transport complex subunit G [Candidatus Omnitrophota bacterium]MCM8770828.1 RnfABCDGE type electron transport complex subunit G [Candidatus Omnitrophota bacterium]